MPDNYTGGSTAATGLGSISTGGGGAKVAAVAKPWLKLKAAWVARAARLAATKRIKAAAAANSNSVAVAVAAKVVPDPSKRKTPRLRAYGAGGQSRRKQLVYQKTLSSRWLNVACHMSASIFSGISPTSLARSL